jgi:M6 family metalloprotease-like protein
MKRVNGSVLFVVVLVSSFCLSVADQLPTSLESRESIGGQILALNHELERLARAPLGDGHNRDGISALMRQRATLLVEIIRQQPAAAPGFELPPDVRVELDQLMGGGGEAIESIGEWEGRLEVIVEDDFERGASRIVYYLTGTHGAFEVVFAESTSPIAAGQVVTISGLRLGRLVAAQQWRLLGGERAESVACSTTGEQKVVVVLVSFPSKPLLSSVTPDMMAQTYFGQGLSLDKFLQESSYSKAWASGQVLGPVVLDADYIGQPTAVRNAAIRAASGLIDFRNFDRIALVVPQASTGLSSGGLGSLGCSQIPLYPSGTTTASTTWLGDVSLGDERSRVGAAIHEMGHNLGLGHARAADFGDEPLGPVGQLPAPWDEVHDYGDSFSNMGRDLGQWAAPHKLLLGWLQGGTDISTVEASGSFTLKPFENAGSGTKAVKLRRGTGNDAWLWLEYRQRSGTFDALLPANAFTGALVHYDDVGWNDDAPNTNLVRFDTGASFFEKAPLVTGRSWTDPYTNLTVNVTHATANGLDVTVSFAQPPTCPSSLSPREQSFEASGGTGSLDVGAPVGCAWTAAPSAPWIQITSGASGTGSGRVTYAVSASSVTRNRWGRIVVGAAVAIVTQRGAAGSASISPTSAEFDAIGGAGEISVSTNAPDFAWSYYSNASWLRSVFCSKMDSVGPATLRYIVAQNTSATARTGTISAAGLTFTVTQAAGGPTVSQLVWQDLDLKDAPTARMCMDMCRSVSAGEAVLYGGAWNTTGFTDTWMWNGSVWTQKQPAHNPGVRCGHAMAYDAERGQVVLFGGMNAGTHLSDTWVWNGVDWSQLSPPNYPTGRAYHAMVYDPTTRKILLFGGRSAGQPGLNDTWEWDGATWTQRSCATTPPVRRQPAMAFDQARSEIVMFGGYVWPGGSPPAFLGDTWVWDGADWQQESPEHAPSPRYGQRMEYDPELGMVVMVGGAGGKDVASTAPFTWVNDYREETWTWNGTDWLQRFPDASPEFSWTYGMVYDSAHCAFTVHLGDNLRCADRGPKSYALKAGPGAILLAPYSAEFAVAGGQGTIAVTAGVAWVASTSDSWITITAGASGSGGGTIRYSIAANAGAGERTGTISVGGQVFSVRQVGAGSRNTARRRLGHS